MDELTIKTIAKIRTDFPCKFGIPRQSGLIKELTGTILFEPEYRNIDTIRELTSFSYIWLLWGFTEFTDRQWTPTVRPPRLGGNKRVGVFASRSPNRPNPIGLSLVKLVDVDTKSENGPIIHVAGIDMIDNSPIYDIKPYLPYYECKPDANTGFSATTEPLLKVKCHDEIIDKVCEDKRNQLIDILSQDPRPAYHDDNDRVYAFEFANYHIQFYVDGNTLYVTDISKSKYNNKNNNNKISNNYNRI